MAYICRKLLTLGDKEYTPGDMIPDGVVLNNRVRALTASGHISELSMDEAEIREGVAIDGIDPMQFADSIGVVLDHTEGGLPITTTMNAEQLQAVFNILMKNAKEAASALEEEVDDTVLEVLKKVDSRKTVKEAAEKQLSIITSIRE